MAAIISSPIKKIFLFGATGMLGNYIHTYFTRNKEINLQRFTPLHVSNVQSCKVVVISYRIPNETVDFDSLENILLENQIDDETCVINCIGLIPQRKSKESSDKEYFMINGLFPQILWSICKKYNAKMIQPTTDCVFSGKKGSYVETDTHDETNSYGISKSLGEPIGCTVIRTSIIGKEAMNKKSFLEWVLANDGKQINGWTNHMWNGITCLEYCKLIEQIISEKMFWSGVHHIYSPTSKSKYELAQIISECFNLNIEITPLISNEIVDKTLASVYENVNDSFQIPELYLQINELKDFELLL